MTPQPKGGPLERNRTKGGGGGGGPLERNFHKLLLKCFYELKIIVLMKENVLSLF